ncbi:MAG: uncharacterized protein KVP18_002494 [Porospora cf. gigantea A]|uniref:uncharacterized protein n=1 Tax=Porospora cf. gigantea A TaxID=2853593 RepID=UPI0035595DE9|nr:MAG: hypothetical protein KVP18_002494 [Porospora cf. gigantea A]
MFQMSSAKPIRTNSGKWSPEEHRKFLEAFSIHGHQWRRVTEHVGSRTLIQVRSHAQKFLNRHQNRKCRQIQSCFDCGPTNCYKSQTQTRASPYQDVEREWSEQLIRKRSQDIFADCGVPESTTAIDSPILTYIPKPSNPFGTVVVLAVPVASDRYSQIVHDAMELSTSTDVPTLCLDENTPPVTSAAELLSTVQAVSRGCPVDLKAVASLSTLSGVLKSILPEDTLYSHSADHDMQDAQSYDGWAYDCPPVTETFWGVNDSYYPEGDQPTPNFDTMPPFLSMEHESHFPLFDEFGESAQDFCVPNEAWAFQ